MRLLIIIHLFGVRLVGEARAFLAHERAAFNSPGRSERGSVTIENVLWAVAVIAIVAIVVAAITAYVTAQAGKLQ